MKKITGTKEELSQMYDDNEAFRRYIDMFCKSREVKKDFALETQSANEYAQYIIEKEADKVKDEPCLCDISDRDPDGDLLTSVKCNC